MILLLRVWFYLVFPILFQGINMLMYWLALRVRILDKQLNIRGSLATINGLLGIFYLMLFFVLPLFKPSGFADLYPSLFVDGDLSAWLLLRGTAWVAMVTFLTHWLLLMIKGGVSFVQSFKIAGSCTAVAYAVTVVLCAVLF